MVQRSLPCKHTLLFRNVLIQVVFSQHYRTSCQSLLHLLNERSGVRVSALFLSRYEAVRGRFFWRNCISSNSCTNRDQHIMERRSILLSRATSSGASHDLERPLLLVRSNRGSIQSRLCEGNYGGPIIVITENVIPEPTYDRATRTKVFRRLKSGFSDAAVEKGVVHNGAIFLPNGLHLS